MTPTRWFIAAFWVFVIVMSARSCYQDNARLESEAKPEPHWFPDAITNGPAAPPQVENADIRMIRYVPKVAPGGSLFTAEIVVKNFGRKKGADIQVRIQPYHGTADSHTQPGPDEIPNPNAVDQMANVFQWVEFPDLPPGETSTKTMSFPMRSDAEPRSSFKPQIVFRTVEDKP